MAADVMKLMAAGQSARWSKWLVFAGAVLVAKGAVKSVSALVATGADLDQAQRGALRELFRM